MDCQSSRRERRRRATAAGVALLASGLAAAAAGRPEARGLAGGALPGAVAPPAAVPAPVLPPVLAPAPALVSAAAGDLRFEPYPVTAADGRRIEAELGRLAVPVRPGGAGTVELVFVRFRGTGPAGAPPLVYLPGGPGGSGIADAEGALLPLVERLRGLGDVVAVDPRGAGRSRPELRCPRSWRLPLDRPAEPGRMLAEASAAARDCAHRLAEAGVDLGAYTAAADADDLERLRRALGAERLRLIGFSYGTRVALLTMARHPSAVDRAVLAGVEPPGEVFTPPADLDRRLAELGARPGAGGADLPGLLRAARDRLAAAPVAIEIDDRRGKGKVSVTVGAFDLQLLVVEALSSGDGVRGLPAELRAVQAGDLTRLAEVAYRYRIARLGTALPYAVKCAEPLAAERAAEIERQRGQALLGAAVDFPFPDICAAWGVSPEPGAAAGPRAWPRPVLLLSGGLDGRTPPANAERVAGSLVAAEQRLVPDAGHGLELLAGPEAAGAVVEFFASE